MRWAPDALTQDADGRLVQRGTRLIEGVFIDSRAPSPGGLFVPIVAARDGHVFIEAAIEGGASAVLVQSDRAEPASARVPDGVTVIAVDDTTRALTRLAARCRDRFSGPVVAITGSNGKTTTRSMISAVTRSACSTVLSTRGNLNNHLGVPLTMLGEPHEPDAMILELGMSAPGENDHLASFVRPTVHVVTNVALEHLEFMGSIEAIAAAEAEPMRHLSPGGAIVVPSDEPLLDRHLPREGATVVRFGSDVRADVRVLEVETDACTTARIRLRGRDTVSVRLRLFGAHNALNAAAALAVGEHLGYAVEPMVKALEQVEPVGDRSRVLRLDGHLLVADCYNANPGSVEVALRSLANLRDRRPRLAVLGDMLELGPSEGELHAAIVRLAVSLGIDALLGVGPRSHATVEAALEGGVEAMHTEDLTAAAAWVRGHLEGAREGAVLVKASRGMRLERLIELLAQEE